MRTQIGLLIVRLGFGGLMLFAHGLDKLINFADKAERFPDPLGWGSGVALGLAVFAEVFCSAAVMLGLMTRLACVPLVITMAIAAFHIHGGDPFERKELALAYLVGFTAIMFCGGGRFAVDNKLA